MPVPWLDDEMGTGPGSLYEDGLRELSGQNPFYSFISTPTNQSSDSIPLSPLSGGCSIPVDDLEIGDIIFSTSSGFVSEAIRTVTSSPVSHTAIYIGDGLLVEAVAGGVKQTTVEEALEGDIVAVAFRVPRITENQKLVIRDWLGQNL